MQSGMPILSSVWSSLPLTALEIRTDDVSTPEEFLFHPGHDPEQMIFLARMASMILVIGTVLLVYFWSRELLGYWWALLPATLFAFSPSILGEGHLATPEAGAVFGTVLALFTFSRYLLSPSVRRFLLAGLGLGIALLSAFPNLLLIPFYIVISVLFLFRESSSDTRIRNFFQGLAHSAGVIALGCIILYLVYSGFSSGIGEFLSGIRSPEAFPASVSWYHFPILFFFKETLAVLLLALIGSAFSLWNILEDGTSGLRFKRFADYLGTHLPEFSMLLYICAYGSLVLILSPDTGFRFLLPVLPLLYILTGGGIKNWMNSRPLPWSPLRERRPARERQILPLSLERNSPRLSRVKTGILSVLILSHLGAALFSSPFFLSHFNAIGNAWNAPRTVPGTEHDRGQDLKRLAQWLREYNAQTDEAHAIQFLAVDYFGPVSPALYLGDTAVPWTSADGDPRNRNMEWIAISSDNLYRAFRNPESDTEIRYAWLSQIKEHPEGIPPPDARIGSSIFLYHL